MLFRLVSIFLTAAITVLSAWALIGSYKNESYLTNNYLMAVQLSNLNVSAIISEASGNAKRDIAEDVLFPTPTENLVKRDTSSLVSTLTTLTASANLLSSLTAASAQATDVSSIIQLLESIASSASILESVVTLAAELISEAEDDLSTLLSGLNALDIGLADMYSVGYWGYCRGSISGDSEKWLKNLGKFGKEFSNKAVTYDYCTSPKAGYEFDPLEILRHEMINYINNTADGASDLVGTAVSEALELQLLAIVGSLTYENLGLPGDLKKSLYILHGLTVASFGLILAGAVLAFISFVFQLMGLCRNQLNTCLSVLNFLLMLLVFITVLLGSALSTGVHMFVRKQINKNVSSYGAMAYLSVQYYAFLWSAVAASVLMMIVAIFGYCCGCFQHSRRYSQITHPEPQMLYDHKI